MKQKDEDKIDDYLNNRMTKEERDAFEKQLSVNETLMEHFEFALILKRVLNGRIENNTLKIIINKTKNKEK